MAIIAAYSMADMENARNVEFKRGKDKKKRKSRAGLIAGGAAGAAALGVAGRYGVAEAKTRLAERRLYNGAGGVGLNGQRMGINTKKDAMSGGAKGAFGRDVERLKKAPGKAWESAKRAGGAIKSGLTTGSGKGGTNAGALREPFNRVGNAVKGTWKSGKVGKAGLLGAGALAAGAAGLGAYKLATRNKKKRG